MNESDPGDAFEIEITDLRTGAPVRGGRGRPSRTASAGAARAWDQDSSLLASGGRKLRRRLTGVASIVAVLVSLAVIAGGSPSVFTALAHLLPWWPSSAEAAPVAPGANTIYAVDSVPWGAFAVDGHRQPLPDQQRGGLALLLSPGAHRLLYQAAPFPTLRCLLTVPASTSDTCPLVKDRQFRAQLIGGGLGAIRIVDLVALPARLSAAQQALLRSAVTAALAQPQRTTLLAGDHYVAQDGEVASASQPLTAELTFWLLEAGASTPARASQYPGPLPAVPPSCASLCTAPPSLIVPPSGCTGLLQRAKRICAPPASLAQESLPIWTLLARVRPAWRYESAASTGGAAVATAAPLAPSAWMEDDETVVALNVEWQGGWSATLAEEWQSGFQCDVATALLSAEVSVGGSTRSGFMLAPAPLRNPLNGCLIDVLLHPGASSTAETSARFLYRCGALVTLDAAAHRLAPGLPPASAHEQALAS